MQYLHQHPSDPPFISCSSAAHLLTGWIVWHLIQLSSYADTIISPATICTQLSATPM